VAWRYPKQRLYEGDIAEPSDLRENLNELNSEFNGYLDNDNFRENTFETGRVQFRTFNEVHSSMKYYDQSLGAAAQFGNPWRDTHSNIGWHSKNEDDYFLVDPITLNVEDDCMVITEFGAHWRWQPVDPTVDYDAEYSGEVFAYYKRGSIIPGTSTKVADSNVRTTYATDSSALSPSNKSHLQRKIFCVQWRVLVDGVIACMSGPMGCDYYHDSVYICGAFPASPGKHKISAEVRCFWYSPATGETRSSDSRSSSVTPNLNVLDRELIVHRRIR